MKAAKVADDLLAEGWAAPVALAPNPLETIARLESLGVAQRNEILRQAELIAGLGHRLVLAEKQRDEAVDAGFRERSARIRVERVNTEQRGRLDALTRANHSYGHGRRSLAGRFGWRSR